MRFKSRARRGDDRQGIGLKKGNAVLHRCGQGKGCPVDRTRHWLAGSLVCSVVAVAVAAIWVPRAEEILNKLLPGLKVTLAYYFDRRP
jgi:hypothetical protein